MGFLERLRTEKVQKERQKFLDSEARRYKQEREYRIQKAKEDRLKEISERAKACLNSTQIVFKAEELASLIDGQTDLLSWNEKGFCYFRHSISGEPMSEGVLIYWDGKKGVKDKYIRYTQYKAIIIEATSKEVLKIRGGLLGSTNLDCSSTQILQEKALEKAYNSPGKYRYYPGPDTTDYNPSW